jgi:hypothetical protein
MKNLDRLKKQNVRSTEPKKSLSTLSLENLRQVTGGASYRHTDTVDNCFWVT